MTKAPQLKSKRGGGNPVGSKSPQNDSKDCPNLTTDGIFYRGSLIGYICGAVFSALAIWFIT